MIDIIFRSLISLIVLFLLTKMLGKRQIAQLSLFDYVLGISIGSIAAEMSLNPDVPYIDGLTALAIYTLCTFLTSILTIKSIRLRRFLVGTPIILVQNGEIISSGLKKVHFDVNDLLEESRNNGYFNLDEIEFAIMETNGRVSFLPKGLNKPVTMKDLDLKSPNHGLVANIIIDGKIMVNNLKEMGKDESWLEKILKVEGVTNKENLLLVTLDHNEKIVIYKKNEHTHTYNVFE